MPRPPDPKRRERRLAKATDYVLEHGLAGLSLRPLAAALDTSPRMLLYDFGTKEQLVDAILAEARHRESAILARMRAAPPSTSGQTLRAVWSWIAAEERRPFLRLFFEVYVDAMTHPERYPAGARPLVEDWLQTVPAVWGPGSPDRATTTLFIAVIRGLLLDRLVATDPERVDAALARFAGLLDAAGV
jgi:AcrR family transcriptional regulator